MSKRFGLLGEVLSYSMSPQIHHAIYEMLEIKATYELVEIPLEAFAEEATALKLKSLDGFNVTIPYKELIMPLLEDVDLTAARIGAVNTVVNENGTFKGYNTDYYGFKICFDEMGIENRHRAIVLGTGGAAKMAVVALEDLGFDEIVIVSRNKVTAQSKFASHECIDYATFNKLKLTSDLLINCTPMGQKVIQSTEIIENDALKSQGFIFDLNYNPSLTPLLAQGSALGVQGINGLKMLIAQAVKAEAIWLQKPLPVADITDEIIKTF